MKGQQRINIQYSIGMEELPSETTRVYKKALTQFRSVQLPDLSKNEMLTSSVIKVIDEARRQLAKTDLMLSDVQSIVNSYVEYEMSLSSTANDEIQEPEPTEYENPDQNQD
jgi:hypothetical protein|tara:strand:- start:1423 stop:1755 length:333 start_codon:yes stop_codon:yes gene_type:complete